MHSIPKEWRWVKLGEVCHTTSGGTPSRREIKYYNGTIPWVKSGELDRGVITDTEEKISEEAIKNSSAKIFPKGTLLIALYGATIGKLAFLGVDAATNQAICGIYQNEKISSSFLYNYLFYKKRKLVGQGIGGAQPNISQTILKDLDIPLPPNPTQQAIVSKIEELFSELDKGLENLYLAQQQLRTYRQAVLKWAFEGRLTNNNVKEGELPKDWKKVKLKEVSDSIQYGYTESSSKEPIGPKFLRITDIQENKVEWDEVPYCKIEKENVRKYLLKEGDLVFARTGATVGKSFLIKGEIPEAVFASYLIRVRVNKEINEKYLSHFFHSPNYWSQITEGQVGIGQPNVNGTKLGQLDLVLVPINEQDKIVQEIESRLSVADKMEESITQSLQQAEALRQSILKKAFEGRLL